MTKLSGINFNNTNRLHLVLVIRIYFDNNFNCPKIYTSSKIPGQIKITSQVPNILNMFKTKYNYISNKAGNIQILVIHFSFYIHNFKLKTEVIIN